MFQVYWKKEPLVLVLGDQWSQHIVRGVGRYLEILTREMTCILEGWLPKIPIKKL